MLGVGIDYDIFFVTRIREEVLNGKTDNEAITTAIEKSLGNHLLPRTSPRHSVRVADDNQHRHTARNRPRRRRSNPNRRKHRHPPLRALAHGSCAEIQLVALQTL